MRSKLIFALTLAAPLAAAPALAGMAPPTIGDGDAAPKAASESLGTALSGAVVFSGGGLQTSFSSGAVAATRTAVGTYTVQFNRSLFGCTPMVAAIGTNRIATIAGPVPADTWNLQSRDLTGALADSDILVLNLCTR